MPAQVPPGPFGAPAREWIAALARGQMGGRRRADCEKVRPPCGPPGLVTPRGQLVRLFGLVRIEVGDDVGERVRVVCISGCGAFLPEVTVLSVEAQPRMCLQYSFPSLMDG